VKAGPSPFVNPLLGELPLIQVERSWDPQMGEVVEPRWLRESHGLDDGVCFEHWRLSHDRSSASSAVAPDRDIGIGMTDTRVEYIYGRPVSGVTDNGLDYRVYRGRGRIKVDYDRRRRVAWVSTQSAIYRTATSFGSAHCSTSWPCRSCLSVASSRPGAIRGEPVALAVTAKRAPSRACRAARAPSGGHPGS
jgi:hypothetical protein